MQINSASMPSTQVTPECVLHYVIKTPNPNIERFRDFFPWMDLLVDGKL